jgi:hypothetical protein
MKRWGQQTQKTPPLRHGGASQSENGTRKTQNGFVGDGKHKVEKKAHSNHWNFSRSHPVAFVSTFLQQKVVTISLSLRSILILGLCAYMGVFMRLDKATMSNVPDTMQMSFDFSSGTMVVESTKHKNSTLPQQQSQIQKPDPQNPDDDHRQCTYDVNESFGKRYYFGEATNA